MAARVTQSVIEVPTLTAVTIRVTQSVIEVAVGLGIICDNPPAGLVGVPYSHTFPAGGGFPPYTFAITSGGLPNGLSLNASTGAVTGTPTDAGLFSFTITVTDSEGITASVSCSINVTRSNLTSIVITFYGWKLYPNIPCDTEPAEVQEAPHVTRAV